MNIKFLAHILLNLAIKRLNHMNYFFNNQKYLKHEIIRSVVII